MWHANRTWGVSRREEVDLAVALVRHTWTLCTAFETPAGTVWVNDSTSEDAIQEFAVLRRIAGFSGKLIQVESITVTWCSVETLLSVIQDADGGEYESGRIDAVAERQLEYEHSPCDLCL